MGRVVRHTATPARSIGRATASAARRKAVVMARYPIVTLGVCAMDNMQNNRPFFRCFRNLTEHLWR